VIVKRQLERLASCYGVTQWEMLEQVLAGAALNALPINAHDAYYNVKLSKPLRGNMSAV
jgi:hypothetical protein